MDQYRCDHGLRSCENCEQCNQLVANRVTVQKQNTITESSEPPRRTLFRDMDPIRSLKLRAKLLGVSTKKLKAMNSSA